MSELKVLLEGLHFPEGPRWHQGRLWFSDMHAHKVIALGLDGRAETICEVPARPSGLGWLPDGRLLIVSMTDRRLLRLDLGGLTVAADLSGLATYHCNDMVVDAKGRAYIGNFGFDLDRGESPRPAELVMVTAEGRASVAARDLMFPNGSVITPDGRTLIVGESFAARLTAFDIQSDGTLTGRRLWADLDGAAPDGIALDAEGAVWVASPLKIKFSVRRENGREVRHTEAIAGSSEVIRVLEGGQVTRRIKPETSAYACMLGGRDRRTLFVATAASSNPDEVRVKTTGRIETIQVETPGAGLP